MLNSIVVILIGTVIILFMLLTHYKDVNKDLERQKQNLQTKNIQEKIRSNIKEFQAYQKAKKEEIKKSVKDRNEKRDVNLSIGSHSIDF